MNNFKFPIISWNIILIFIIPLYSYAQEVNTTKSTLQEVSVFSLGANMHHTTPNVRITKGNSELVINQISRQLNPESIRIQSSNSNLKIQSVSFEQDYLSNIENKSSSYLAIKRKFDAEKEILTHKINERLSEESTLSLLESSKNVGGANGVTPSNMANMLTFYREEHQKILSNILKLKKEEEEQEKLVNQLKKQLAELGGENAQAGQLVLRLYSEHDITTSFEIEYYTSSVNWHPSYEIQVNHLDQPVSLVYNANLSQHTGIDWHRTPLRFSSGQPHINNTLPDLNPWWISFVKKISPAAPSAPMLRTMEKTTHYVQEVALMENSMSDMAVVENSQLQTSFVIETPYDVFTNKKPIAIQLQSYKLPAKYNYYSIPSQQDGAYLIANISNWEQYNFLPGDAQLIIDNQYAGKSYINPKTTSDTLKISLGKDQRIHTQRKRVDEEGSKSFLGNTQKRSYKYETEIRNTRNETIEIQVKEQFPISTEKDINIKLDQTSDAQIDNQKGELIWNITLKPNQVHKLKFGYTITFPKGKDISGI